MNNDLLEIKNRLNIIDILGEYLRLEKAGTNYRAICPFHNEKTPSFMVSEERQMWHCFGCQKGGDIFSFVMEIEGLEFREALKLLADKAGVKLSGYDPEKQKKENRSLEILELATKFYEVQLWKGAGKGKILEYLKERGFSQESIQIFRLGYAPRGWRNLLDFLLKRGYGADEIERTGLLVKKDKGDSYDRFRDRIMFPITDTGGKVVGFSARVAPGGDESQAKYVNTPETDTYHKSRILYGIDKAKTEIKKQDFVLLVEGNADVVAAHQAGIKNTVAVSGTALTEEQISILKRYTRNTRMFFDMDSAGESATRKSVRLGWENGMNIKVVSSDQGKDAAEIVKENEKGFQKAVEEALPAMEYFFQRIFHKYDKRQIEDKKKIVDEILEWIGLLPDEIEKNFWMEKLSLELAIDMRILTDRLKKASLLSSRRNRLVKYPKDSDPLFPKGKQELILESLIFLMLAFPEVWKETQEKKTLQYFLSKDSLLNLVISSGGKHNFNFESWRDSLEDEKMKSRVENLFFEKKFRLGINNQIEEIFIQDPFQEFQKLKRELVLEESKENLSRIAHDLKKAQEIRDKEAERLLRQESKRISEILSQLI